MDKIAAFFEGIGARSIGIFSSVYEVFHFSFVCFFHAVQPKSYNPAMVSVLVRQIYFTAVQLIPLFVVIAVLFGSAIVGVIVSLATTYSLQSEMGSILVTFVLDEFAPFFTAFLISLRSGAAINTEIALMKVNNELHFLEKYKIDIIDYLFLPRIIAGIISVTFLSLLLAFLMLVSGYLFSFVFMHIDLNTYKHMLITALSMQDFVILLVKSFSFGLVIMLIPIFSGLKTQKSYTAVPVSVLQGMVRLFIAVFVIEVILLVVQSLL